MKIKKKRLIQDLEERIITKFLWFPLTLPDKYGVRELRWLEKAKIKQSYDGMMGGIWDNCQWVDSNYMIGVYSLNLGNYDKFNSIPKAENGIRYKYYTDSDIQLGGYKMIKIKPHKFDGFIKKSSRYLKCNSQDVYPEVDYSIYLDASFIILNPDFQILIDSLGEFDIAQFAHPVNNSLYKEAELLLEHEGFKDEHKKIKNQVKHYKDEHFPKEFGLFAGGFIIRKHSEKVFEFNKLWWNEILNGTYRDQVSEMYCIWKTGLKFVTIPGNIYDNEWIKFNNK